MACIDDIVSIGLCADDVSTSGYTLMKAPGMSPKNAQNVAQEQYVTGTALLETIKSNSINAVRTDLIGTLQANNVVSILSNKEYESATFNTAKHIGTYPGYRGQVVHSVNDWYKGTMRQLKIKGVQCYPLFTGDGEIHIVDYISGVQTTTSYDVSFVENSLNTFIFPTPYILQSTNACVVTDQTTNEFCSSNIICRKGCNNTAPNQCAWVDGYNGSTVVRQEGYGLNVIFYCECDYDVLICDLSKSFTGELIWLKMQEMFYEEQYKSNRFNAWCTYNKENIIKEIIPDLQSKYAIKYNNMLAGGLLNMLKTYKDDCLNCRGIRKVVNV